MYFSHSSSSRHIKAVFNLLSNYRNEDIILASSFFYGGMYEYSSDTVTPMGAFFNSNKVRTFNEYYLDNKELNIIWFALIDDTLSEDVYKGYQESKAMVGLRPSSKDDYRYNNLMYRSTSTKNFSGVIELLDKYIADIKGMTRYEIIDRQRNMPRHLSSYELQELIRNGEFQKVISYLKSGMADFDDYRDTYQMLLLFCDELDKSNANYIDQLLSILEEKGVLEKTKDDIKKLILKE